MITISCCIPGGSFMPEGEGKISITPYERLTFGYQVITSLGYDRVEATVGLVAQLSDDDRKKLVDARNAGSFRLDVCNSLIGLPIVTDEEGTKAVHAYLDTVFSQMAELGVKIVVFGSGRARSIPEGTDRAEGEKKLDAFLEYADGLCEKYDMTLVIEPLNKRETNWVNTVAQGAEVVRRLNLPHIRLLADGFHMACEGEDPAVMAENGDILLHTHLAAAPDRVYPGKCGGEYETKFLRTLLGMGYDGCVTVECGFSDFASEAKLASGFMKAVLGR